MYLLNRCNNYIRIKFAGNARGTSAFISGANKKEVEQMNSPIIRLRSREEQHYCTTTCTLLFVHVACTWAIIVDMAERVVQDDGSPFGGTVPPDWWEKTQRGGGLEIIKSSTITKG